MRAIITAAGSGSRWNNYLGVRKHQAMVNGERLIDRTVRLLQARGISDIVITCHPHHPYHALGARTVTIPYESSNAMARLATRPFWHLTDRTLVVLGDVYLTEAAADIMVKDHGLGWTHFARLKPSAATGKPGAEMFGCSFGPEDHDVYADALHRAGPGSDWPAYCAFTGHPVDTEPNDIRDWGHHVEIPDDGTDDFDFPDDFERFLFHRGLGPRRVRRSDFDEPWFEARMKELDAFKKIHRKLWEHCSIAQAFVDRFGSGHPRNVLGFGVGKERLPAWFAEQGASVVATDRPAPGVWNTAQHAAALADLPYEGITSKPTFDRNVAYQPVDMRDIPIGLHGRFDFTWSTSCLEHLGGVRAGMNFFLNQMRCLKHGGIAAHTTEFLIGGTPFEAENLCVFTGAHLIELTHLVAQQGNRLWPILLTPGTHPHDAYVDHQPFQLEPHLNLKLGNATFTSVLLIAARMA
jgi:SAM-dependent methyltransferase